MLVRDRRRERLAASSASGARGSRRPRRQGGRVATRQRVRGAAGRRADPAGLAGRLLPTAAGPGASRQRSPASGVGAGPGVARRIASPALALQRDALRRGLPEHSGPHDGGALGASNGTAAGVHRGARRRGGAVGAISRGALRGATNGSTEPRGDRVRGARARQPPGDRRGLLERLLPGGEPCRSRLAPGPRRGLRPYGLRDGRPLPAGRRETGAGNQPLGGRGRRARRGLRAALRRERCSPGPRRILARGRGAGGVRALIGIPGSGSSPARALAGKARLRRVSARPCQRHTDGTPAARGSSGAAGSRARDLAGCAGGCSAARVCARRHGGPLAADATARSQRSSEARFRGRNPARL